MTLKRSFQKVVSVIFNTCKVNILRIGVPDDFAAGGREGICPENAIAKPEERGQEAALGPQI